ncbi:hypothetical protein [Nocardioides zhouii]|uniref:Uncharacterized protein n=1 Tax=Nocardioides zhouii TaxID=1168729 RepID=A0A4Q2T1P1_9ACTN|nr:hypothetical protein [Nocardioides zhouii]RYC10549.1 hypothetical protein EUA94_12180 [Nocardioides zhouii]
MIPGSVDPKTGNVPLHLGEDYWVHFEGRTEDGLVLVRMMRKPSTGPLLGLDGARGLREYIDGIPACASDVSTAELEAWLDLRVAELGGS